MERRLAQAVAAAAIVTSTAWIAAADPVVRGNWIPGTGTLADLQAKGDLWTFRCPKGGFFTASVDTHDDLGNATATIEPTLVAFDGAGEFIDAGLDDVDCTHPPVCGGSCPEIAFGECGPGKSHSLVVHDFYDNACGAGGGYTLTLEVFDKNDEPVAEKRVKLGGGKKRKLPKWIDPAKTHQPPALDDESVPGL